MDAATAVRRLLRELIEQSNSHLSAARNSAKCGHHQPSPAERIKEILRPTGFTMTQISAATKTIYGEKEAFFVPPTFLYKQKRKITPHICQVAALSKVTGYRFRDWMRVWGYDLKLIVALQLAVHGDRTVLITPDDETVALAHSRELHRCRSQYPAPHYVFAKIGFSDAVAYPAILPGSIVRAHPGYFPEIFPEGLGTADAFWLVEHPGGIACCRIARIDETYIVLLPNRSPLPSWPLRIEREVRILGLVDHALRPPDSARRVNDSSPKFEHRPMWRQCSGAMSVSKLLIGSRSRAGLTLRAAHEMTLAVARLLGNPNYAIALGQLSDYEAMNKLPRHIDKIISLCVVYSIHLRELLAAAGIDVDDSGKTPMAANENEFLPHTNSYCESRIGEQLDCNVEGSWIGGRAKATSVVA